VRNVIVFNTITELSGCKHFGRIQIKDCISSVCYKLGVPVETIDMDAVIEEVEEAFSALRVA